MLILQEPPVGLEPTTTRHRTLTAAPVTPSTATLPQGEPTLAAVSDLGTPPGIGTRTAPGWRTHPKSAPHPDGRRHSPTCDLRRWFHPPLKWSRPPIQPPCNCGVDQARAAEVAP